MFGDFPAKNAVYTPYLYGSGRPYKYTVIHGAYTYVWFWPTLQIYGHTRCIYMVLANPTNIWSYTVYIYGSGQPYKYTVIHGVYIWFWPTLQIYGHTRCIYMVLANPTNVRSYTVYIYGYGQPYTLCTVIHGVFIYGSGQPYKYTVIHGVYKYGSGQPCTLCTVIHGVYIWFWPTLHVMYAAWPKVTFASWDGGGLFIRTRKGETWEEHG